MKLEYEPIGIVHSPFKEPEGTPIQPSRAKNAVGKVEVFQEFVDGLSDLDGFSHIILLCHLHKTGRYRLKVVPFLDTQLRGLLRPVHQVGRTRLDSRSSSFSESMKTR